MEGILNTEGQAKRRTRPGRTTGERARKAPRMPKREASSMERWTADRIADQTGRTFIVTGANSGLGFETARQLAAHGARVVLTARSESKGADAVGRIRTAHPGAIVEYRLLDLADLTS